MFYPFPKIENLSDVLPAIEGRKEFVVAVKDYFTVVNYVLQTPETFCRREPGWEIRRECRGIKFCNTTGKILQRPLHKFFNLGENEELLPENVPWSEDYTLFEKLDGSMVVPIMVEGGVRWTTKMGITSVALQAEKYIATQPNLQLFAKSLLEGGATPVFEYTGPENRIVVDYKEEKMTLLAIRETVTGEYHTILRDHIVGVDVVPTYFSDFVDRLPVSLEDRLEIVRGEEGSEGVVVTFHNGHRCKVKGAWYVALHRAKDAVQKEHNLVGLIVNNLLDDSKAVMDLETLKKVEDFEKEFVQLIANFSSLLDNDWFEVSRICGDDRKHYALNNNDTKLWQSWIFSLFSGKGTSTEIILRSISAACTKEASWKEFKEKLGLKIEWRGVLWQTSEVSSS